MKKNNVIIILLLFVNTVCIAQKGEYLNGNIDLVDAEIKLNYKYCDLLQYRVLSDSSFFMDYVVGEHESGKSLFTFIFHDDICTDIIAYYEESRKEKLINRLDSNCQRVEPIDGEKLEGFNMLWIEFVLNSKYVRVLYLTNSERFKDTIVLDTYLTTDDRVYKEYRVIEEK